MTEFARWLEGELKKRGWTRADLARRAHVSQSTLSLIWTGTRQPGPDICRAIAKALGYPQWFVFVKAGLLEDSPDHYMETAEAQTVLNLLRLLPPEDRREVLEYLQFKVAQAQKRRSREHTPAPGD